MRYVNTKLDSLFRIKCVLNFTQKYAFGAKKQIRRRCVWRDKNRKPLNKMLRGFVPGAGVEPAQG